MMKDRYEVTVAVPAEAVKPLLKLDKNIVRAELTINEIFFEECRYHFAKKEYLLKRLFFLKKFGFPLGCIESALYPWRTVIRASCTADGRKADYAYNGVRFMDKIIKPTKDGWQMELRYRE